jgi:hypothetical protein
MSTILKDLVTFSHEFGGCSLNDPSLVDWPGAFKVICDDLDVWRSTADVNVVRAPRGVGDGDYVASRFPMKARTLMIEGMIHAPTRLLVDQMFDLLVDNAFPLDTDITITRQEPIPKYVVGRIAGKVEDLGYFSDGMRWGATVLCADPLKYDAVNTLSATAGVSGVSTGGRTYPRVYPLVYNITANGTGNQVTVNNVGKATTLPVITLTGPLPSGWRMENATTGATESFAIDLGVFDTLTIDNKNKVASLNGNIINGLIAGTWWGLVPGNNIIRLFGNYDPAASFTITAKSAWR